MIQLALFLSSQFIKEASVCYWFANAIYNSQGWEMLFSIWVLSWLFCTCLLSLCKSRSILKVMSYKMWSQELKIRQHGFNLGILTLHRNGISIIMSIYRIKFDLEVTPSKLFLWTSAKSQKHLALPLLSYTVCFPCRGGTCYKSIFSFSLTLA